MSWSCSSRRRAAQRWSLREVVGPVDMQRAGDVGALQPGDEQPDAAADARAVGDPGVEQVLAQVAKLELLGVQPTGELDRLADQRARVLLRRDRRAAGLAGARELVGDL